MEKVVVESVVFYIRRENEIKKKSLLDKTNNQNYQRNKYWFLKVFKLSYFLLNSTTVQQCKLYRIFTFVLIFFPRN